MLVPRTCRQGSFRKPPPDALRATSNQTPRVGGISSEIRAGKDTKMMIKHKSNEPVDRKDLETAVAKAGDYQQL